MALDFKRGHQKWTMAELSRVSGVKRPLIYYYFGKSRVEILLAAVKVLGEDCFGLSDRRVEMWKRGEMDQSIRESRKFLQDQKELAGFYFLHRAKDNAVGEALRLLERKYREKFCRYFPSLNKNQQEQLAAFFFGLVFIPDLSDEALESCLASLRIPGRASSLTASI